ncbi:TOBE domain-containing protein [Streptantibioticus ferralitis]|uniref:Helix-turn-helix transcriptional regulator n=1 Tax=Streptantibioticus ferralitis TaxID=236510 RepID=A0ABT5YZ16_9ACTN|nr:helix-turn-helix transcriptional regulator [Streptantibioticus ferralitis]MDF2256689.1 helix-turn-helix transcriptional regulator [Streptantibioticus ferralitis]
MPSYSIGQAARLLGVSGETVRRWADAGRVATERDDAGNRVIDGASLAAFAVDWAAGVDGAGAEVPTSVRNGFRGIVTAVHTDGVVAQVEIQAGPHRLVSLVTREAVEDLGLAVGVAATARVKSTSVHVDRRR